MHDSDSSSGDRERLYKIQILKSGTKVVGRHTKIINNTPSEKERLGWGYIYFYVSAVPPAACEDLSGLWTQWRTELRWEMSPAENIRFSSDRDVNA